MELKGLWEVVRKNRLLFLLGVAGLVLLLFVGRGTKEADAAPSPLLQCESYRAALEEELASLCGNVRGVGRVRVFLTLASTELALYEKNVSGDSETLASVGGEGLLVAYEMPRVRGVTVVCEGGGDPVVKAELYALLSAALSLRATQIHVAPIA